MRLRAPAKDTVFIYLLFLSISLRSLDCSLEGFIPLLDLVNGCLAGLRGEGHREVVRRVAGGACSSVHPSTHATNIAESVLALDSKHTLTDLREEKLLPSDYRCEN